MLIATALWGRRCHPKNWVILKLWNTRKKTNSSAETT